MVQLILILDQSWNAVYIEEDSSPPTYFHYHCHCLEPSQTVTYDWAMPDVWPGGPTLGLRSSLSLTERCPVDQGCITPREKKAFLLQTSPQKVASSSNSHNGTVCSSSFLKLSTVKLLTVIRCYQRPCLHRETRHWANPESPTLSLVAWLAN